MNTNFWKDKQVFITGHTGFKGSWLCLWLHLLGARVTGYALHPPTEPSLFKLCNINNFVSSIYGDILDSTFLNKSLNNSGCDIVIHMAAQPLVRDSYQNPVQTYMTNVIGTVNVLEALRNVGKVKAFVNITSDKCYDNKSWYWGYRENEPLGGYDPYSNSKACSELVTAAYRDSFFNNNEYKNHGLAVATARAGNVIGGGDWAKDRLITDCIAALLAGKQILIRSPHAIRPWQHVLEPLAGYLTLAQKLYEKGVPFAEGWNFGPNDEDAKPVEAIVTMLCEKWGGAAGYIIDNNKQPHEATFLKLDCSKAKNRLAWYPKWNLEKAIDSIVAWNKDYIANKNLTETCFRQITEYMECK